MFDYCYICKKYIYKSKNSPFLLDIVNLKPVEVPTHLPLNHISPCLLEKCAYFLHYSRIHVFRLHQSLQFDLCLMNEIENVEHAYCKHNGKQIYIGEILQTFWLKQNMRLIKRRTPRISFPERD